MNYLNIFEHYKHEIASIPLENNLTRVFARILRDNCYIADQFFKLINDNYKKEYNCSLSIGELDAEYNVSIQKSINDLNDILPTDSVERQERVIGVALTAKNIEWSNYSDTRGTDKQKPDIFFCFNDYYFIIEVKKTEEDCSVQLDGYLSKLDVEKKIKRVSITWDDVIEILEKSQGLHHNDLIVDEYLEYVKAHFYQLFNYRSLSYSCTIDGEVNEHSESFVRCRIELALNNVYIIDNNKYFCDSKNNELWLKKHSFQQRVIVDVEDNKLILTTWFPDTGEQMIKFYEYYKNGNFSIKDPKQKTALYVKFANVGSWLHTFELNKEFNNDTRIFEDLYKVTGRCKGIELRNNLNEVIKITKSNVSVDDDEKVVDYINRDTNKDISVGMRICDFIPLKELVGLDNDFNKNMQASEDKIAHYLYDYIINEMIYEL